MTVSVTYMTDDFYRRLTLAGTLDSTGAAMAR
jgi:hypothetical protein